MRCERCRHENRASARFCEQCGAPVSLACPACGSPFSESARFCPQCGRPVSAAVPASDHPPKSSPASPPRPGAETSLASRTALEGERKQVTVLFADLKSSMELLAHRDPEEARRILDPVVELMMEAVHHYEGTVNQVMGDGIMALFGAPVAYEDHAIRGCYAALRMQALVRRHADREARSGGAAIRMRVGLHSGEVVVRSVSNDLHMDYTAVGQTTHLAARMEQMAEPGSIMVTADTLRLVEGYVAALSLGRLPVRGLEQPVEVYRITGTGAVRSRLATAAALGLTQFVGREAELALLHEAMRAAADGHGQVVGVVGEPGVGKSRLFHELARPERMPGWLVLSAGAVSHATATAYGPLIDLLRVYFGLHGQAEQQHVAQRIRDKVADLDEGLAPFVPALCALLDAPVEGAEWSSLDSPQRRQLTMDALRRLVRAESQRQPLCLVLEDLHWIDSETQAFLDSVIDVLPGARVLLLVNYRPEYRHQWGGKTYYSQLRVDPLGPRNAEELLRRLLGDDGEMTPLHRLLIERTQGNPFFLEESVRSLAESGVLAGERGAYHLVKPVETIRMPTTIQTVLSARIDRLPPEDKRLLQAAAAIGESVPGSLLEAVADTSPDEVRESLARLVAAEFLHDISLFPETQYVFRHGLTCLVAYTSLLHERRRALHARVVHAIERLHGARPGEQIERLAHHAREGEMWDRAARYHREAGLKAFSRSANREAVAWFDKALQVVAHLPDDPTTQAETLELHLGLRNALTLLGEHEATLSHLHEAQALAERLHDRVRLGRALSFEVNCLFLLGQHERAIERAGQALSVAEELKDFSLKTVTEMYAGRAHLCRGNFARAIEIFGRIVGALSGPLASDRLGVPILPSVFARSHLVECLSAVGRFAEAARHAEEAIALAEAAGHPDTTLWAYHGAGVCDLARGQVQRATKAFERAYALCRAHDMPAYRPRISAELGLAWALDGRAAEALLLVQQAVEQTRARRQPASYSHVLLLSAEVYLLADRLSEAAGASASALEFFRQQGEGGHEARVLWLLGEIAARREPNAAAVVEAYYEEARGLGRALQMRPLVARCDLGLARLFARTGRGDRARQSFLEACAGFRELGMSVDLARVEVELQTVR